MSVKAIHIMFITIVSCGSIKNNLPNSNRKPLSAKIIPYDFTFISYKDTFDLTIERFYKNDAFCYTEGIPFALIIGRPVNKKDLPVIVSILARCDNNTYIEGEIIRIRPIENPENNTSLKKINFITDTIINKVQQKWILGSEYPALWARVINRI